MFILQLVIGFLFIIGAIFSIGYFKNRALKMIAGTVLFVIAFMILTCITSIPANNVGVLWSPFGGTKQETLSEGIVFKSPLDKVYKIPTTVQERSIDGVSVQTKDAQFLTMSVNIKFQVNKSNAFTVFQRYTTIDNLKDNIIANYGQKAIESVVTEYNIIEVLGEKKNEVYSKSTIILQEMLAKEGVNLVEITIKDMDAGDAIEQAIQDEAVAKKAVETAEQLKQKAQIEAETKLIEAQGEADANAVKTQQLTDPILTEMWINKWDGKLPTVSGSDNMMIDVNSLLGTE